MATVFHLNIRAVVGILLDAGIFVANGVCAVYRQCLCRCSVEDIAIVLHLVVIHGLGIFICRCPFALMILGKRMIDVYLGIFVFEYQGCHGIRLRVGGFSVHPVGGCLRALVRGGSSQEVLYVGCACAVVEVCGIRIISHVFISQFMHHLLDVRLQVPCLAVGSGELEVLGILAVYLCHKCPATVDDEETKGVALLEVAGHFVGINVYHLSLCLRLFDDSHLKPHGMTFCRRLRRRVYVVTACCEYKTYYYIYQFLHHYSTVMRMEPRVSVLVFQFFPPYTGRINMPVYR